MDLLSASSLRASSKDFAQLLVTLKETESDIGDLFARAQLEAVPVAYTVVIAKQLEARLIELIESVTSIPAELTTLSREWNDKVGVFMERFAALNSATKKTAANCNKTTKDENSSFVKKQDKKMPFDPIEMDQKLTQIEARIAEEEFPYQDQSLDELATAVKTIPVSCEHLLLKWRHKMDLLVAKFGFSVNKDAVTAEKDEEGTQLPDLWYRPPQPPPPLQQPASVNPLVTETTEERTSAKLSTLTNSLDKFTFSKSSTNQACPTPSNEDHQHDENGGDRRTVLSSTAKVFKPTAATTVAPPAEESSSASSAFVENELFTEIERAFDKMPPVRSSADMITLRRLLPLIAKAKKIVEPYGRESAIHTRVYSLALAKFSPDLEAIFKDPATKLKHHNLTSLANFLFGHIKGAADAQLADAVATGQQATDEWAQLFRCKYCKTTGHEVNACPSRKATFCFNCYEFGHSMKRCPMPDSASLLNSTPLRL